MQAKKGLDAHLVKKYATTSTVSQETRKFMDSEKIWNHLGLMGQINLASIKPRKSPVAL